MRMKKQLTTGRPRAWLLGWGLLGGLLAAVIALVSGGSPIVIAVAATAAVAIVVIVLGLIHPRLLARHRDTDALERAFGVPVLIELPRGSGAEATPVIMLSEVGTDVEAADPYRRLRSMLARLGQLGGLESDRARVVLVSSVPGTAAHEGLAVVANLALVAADTDQRVVVVEADLVDPVLDELLPVASAPGLADAVAGGRRRADGSFDTRHLLQATGRDGVSVVAQGNPVRRAGDVLGRLEEFFATVGGAHDLVMVHGPPVDRVDEVVELLAYVDQLVVVTGADVDPDHIDQVRRLVHGMGAPLVGIALTARRSATAPWTPAERPVMVPPPASDGLVGTPAAPDVPLSPALPDRLEVAAGLERTATQPAASSSARPPSLARSSDEQVWQEFGELLSGPAVAPPVTTPAVTDSGPISVEQALAEAVADGPESAPSRAPEPDVEETVRTPSAPAARRPPFPPSLLADLPPPAPTGATPPLSPHPTAVPGVESAPASSPDPDQADAADPPAVEAESAPGDTMAFESVSGPADDNGRTAVARPIDLTVELHRSVEKSDDTMPVIDDDSAADIDVLQDIQFDLLAELEDEDDVNPSRR